MELEKIRNLSDDELVVQQRQAAEQLFRLRFQLSTGQQDGVKKLRELKKDIARMKTIARYRELSGTHVTTTVKAEAAPKKAAKKSAKRALKKSAPKKAAKKAAPKKKSAAKSAKGAK